ncbi:rhodanese-like domain-containing protein [Corynebacterium capitovis]|uniref:rhodanese-like domain-containing protein n=1 Tax=Corynebacterium capitovis TaxID=131081 RepID=UPI00035E422F|nr:rhodanese-like domain-containing protein [Corynebacterium capitovis]
MKSVQVTEVPRDAQLIDVREPEEYAEVHAEGAVNMPLSEFVERAGEIDPDRDIYVICRSGGRSAQACEYLEKARGWDNAINVEGGTLAWVDADLPRR